MSAWRMLGTLATVTKKNYFFTWHKPQSRPGHCVDSHLRWPAGPDLDRLRDRKRERERGEETERETQRCMALKNNIFNNCYNNKKMIHISFFSYINININTNVNVNINTNTDSVQCAHLQTCITKWNAWNTKMDRKGWSDYNEPLRVHETVSWFLWWWQMNCNSQPDHQWKDCCVWTATVSITSGTTWIAQTL